MIDLFAGCGGLTDGFLQTKLYDEIAAVDWLKPQVETLRKRLKSKWNISHADESVMFFDIQNEKELFSGWNNDLVYGSGKGLDYFINNVSGIDLIIGGPPCQAYSVAGRVRDENGMKNDYRNFLFEHYLTVVNRYKPKAFVFENVPGLLSAAPNGKPIKEIIKKAFNNIGYDIIEDLKSFALINASDFGVPQNRKRLIILGIRKELYRNSQQALRHFYIDVLSKYKVTKITTVKDAISDLPACKPILHQTANSTKASHITPPCEISWHVPRYNNSRDIDTFRILALDLKNGTNIYNSKKISELYAKKIGSSSPIHRYHVLDPNKPSTTIIAHLYKDGNRFIHYDPTQARTITVREAARLQSFDDDFDFVGTQGNAYQMIGNAVPPLLAKNIALAIYDFLCS